MLREIGPRPGLDNVRDGANNVIVADTVADTDGVDEKICFIQK